MSDRESKRKSGKVRFDSGSGSSRASTVGGSSTSSGHSGSQYTTHYNVNALEESMRVTVAEMDAWKRKALEAEKSNNILSAQNRGLENSVESLQDAQKDSAQQIRELKAEVESLNKDKAKLARKLEKYETRSPPSSPDGSKPHRSGSKRSPKDTDADTHNARLKERFNRTGDTSSEGSSSKPPSSSKAPAPHRSGSVRRQSFSSATSPHAERGPAAYDGVYGPASPVSPGGGSSRRPEYVASPHPHHHHMAAAAPYPAQMYATPRSAAMPMPVQYAYASPYVAGYPAETGNYQPHPLPR